MKNRIIFFSMAVALLTAGIVLAVEVRDVVFKTKNAGKVVFSHSVHMKGMANNCRACHDAIFSMKTKVHFTMADMGKGKSCGACHNGKKAFKLQECARCHQTKDIVYKVKATGPTRFSHKKHLTGKPDCGVCHPGIFAAGSNQRFTMAEMKKGKSCGACHNGKKAFGIDRCNSCHPTKEISFKVKETGPTLFSHKSHLKVSSCGKCHPGLYSPMRSNKHVDMAAMEKGKSCGACHNGKDAFSVKECSKCHPVRNLVFEDKDAGNVVFSHTSHTGLYKCGDCHTALFNTARSKVKVSMKKMESGISCGACHDGKTAFTVSKNCELCHKM